MLEGAYLGGAGQLEHVGREIDAEGLSGDLTLVDAETGQELAVTLDREARGRYRAAVDAWLQDAADAAQRGGVGYFRLDAAAGPVEDRLLRWLREAERARR